MPPERDLFANFERMRREMDELFGDVFDRTGLAPAKRGGFSPAVDVFYQGDPPRAVVQAELAGIDPDEVTAYLGGLPGVTAVHDLHIWAMSTTEAALTVHLIRPGAGTDDAWLGDVCEALSRRFGIPHATVQVENGDGEGACRLASADVV